ncbi:hypothetical protein EZL32_21230, partial [Salmonella enterica]|nr:hypothetical protein [Salmonella enterica]ECB4775592.1 hypothetical protein [Salmonella enterica subsp. enterica serovar Montevideo]EAO2106584.1 hypothetical protein [Salmonella enterica]EAO2787498.1 hypothetical protein [Salmonella enterica]EAO3049737.1 hypothetical protein [Salmonella enterica]
MGITRGFAGECSKQSFFCNFSIAVSRELPIMRLHRHGGCESLHTNSRSVEEKILKFRVDSERGKRNIRHLATVSESRVALLFNNLSDNLCGHSKIRILDVA